jgi:very-short-patch-repair endonuclease
MKTAAISRRTGSGEWELVRPRVYRIAGAPSSYEQAVMAAVLWAGVGAVASHATAATLHRMPDVRHLRLEVTVPGDRAPRAADVTVHRSGRLDRADRMTVGPIPVTTPVRTLIDIASRMTDERLLASMEHLVRCGVMSPERLAARLDALRTSGRSGAGRLAQVLEQRGAAVRPLESPLEARVELLLRRAGVAVPRRQYDAVVAGRRYRLDFAWPARRVALECDGFEHHGRRDAFDRDRARLSDLTVAGWRVLVVTSEHVDREPHRVLGWVRAALGSSP